MDYIFIQGLVVYGVIGVYQWERQAPQRLIVDVTLGTDIHLTASHDAIDAESLDYGLLAIILRKLVEQNTRHTLEALAEDLAAACLQQPGAQRVRLRLQKPGAVPFAESAGIEIERERER